MKQFIQKAFLPIVIITSLLLSACAVSTNSSMVSTSEATTQSTASASANEKPEGNPPDGGKPQGNPLDGEKPSGNPPDGNQPGGSSSDASSYNFSGTYTVDGSSESQSGQTYTATTTDQSAVYVINGGKLTLQNITITSSGDSSSSDASSFYGLNAGVLATSGSSIDLSDSNVTTTGDGANGVFATGEGSTITIADTTIDCSGQYAHAVMATQGGVLNVTNVDMNTAGASSGAIATDRGSGTINVTGGTVRTSGSGSPGIYSTGNITVSGTDIAANGSEAAVIEGSNSITLNDVTLTSSYDDFKGVMIYQSMSGDAEGSEGTFTMTGGSLSYTGANGPLFYITNASAAINLNAVNITVASNILLKAATDRWGTEGSNGGNATLTADDQVLSGDFLADSISSLAVVLKNGSSLTGAINPDGAAQSAALTLDATSIWTVTADSHLTTLEDSAGISGTSISNVIGNGFTVTYDADANPSLGGLTYTLSGGGTLTPAQ
jgi:hypothetical protein